MKIVVYAICKNEAQFAARKAPGDAEGAAFMAARAAPAIPTGVSPTAPRKGRNVIVNSEE